ncbi:MAG TPA: nuclear transport factor 2 family protein [Burkholderiales bacterium]
MATATELVREYLETWADRDLQAAQRFLAPGFTMIYPGDARFTGLEELATQMARRYRSVRKRFERFDELAASDGTVVYCFGTLYGEFADGRSFDGVRFIDRFTVEHGRLVDHRVWNDLPR